MENTEANFTENHNGNDDLYQDGEENLAGINNPVFRYINVFVNIFLEIGKIFVGGLSWQTTADGLRFYFEKFGELSDVALMTDKRTGQPRGFGFITLKDPSGNNRC